MSGAKADFPAGPRAARRPPWVLRHRRRGGWRWRFEHSFPLRLLLALAAAVALLGAVERWENCRTDHFARGCLLTDPGGVISVDNLESLSIVTAAFLYLLERTQRRQRENMQAMEVILACQQAGARLSLARNDGLELLSGRGIWLDGLDLSRAMLDDLHAPRCRWREVILRGASLQRICLEDGDLQGADLSGADLRGARLRHADLRRALFRDSDLREADLRGADLRGADLRGAVTTGARLEGASLEGADRGDAVPEGS